MPQPNIPRLLAATMIAWLSIASPAIAVGPVRTPHVEAELIGRHTGINTGQPIEIALRLKIADHWHTYWQNPGDSGLPTRLTWDLPEGFSADPIQWPHPRKLPLGPLMNFGYEGEVLHLVTLHPPGVLKAGRVTFNAKAAWLVCRDVCIPEEAKLSLSLPVREGPPLEDPRWAANFAAAHLALPKAIDGWSTKVVVVGKSLQIDLTPVADRPMALKDVAFYPYRDDVIANAGKQTLSPTASGYRLTVPMADPVNAGLKTLDGVLVSSLGWGTQVNGNAALLAAAASYAAPEGAATSATGGSSELGLITAIVFALIGGLILNLMPCVFPVLGIKVMGFVAQAQHHRALVRRQGAAFFAGVMISFWVLASLLIALRTAGEAVGWGFQLQSPAFVTLLAALFLLLSLNLAGMFEMGVRLQTAAGNVEAKGGRGLLREAFLSGVLATIIATPCSAPFMGAALGFTLSQPAWVSMLVFSAVAAGMALPVTLLSLMPKWLAILPRPGPWMETFKQFMAFPLLATVVWLVWVLGSQQGNDGAAKLLMGLVIVGLGAWIYGRWQVRRPMLAISLGICIVMGGVYLAWPDAMAASKGEKRVDDAGWIPFSKQRIAELRNEGKPIFVDFTASWCISCQVNKRLALNQADVVKRFDELGVVRMRADWTVQDPAITAALAEFGRNGVPLYVYYPRAAEPQILPEVLTPSMVLSALGGNVKSVGD